MKIIRWVLICIGFLNLWVACSNVSTSSGSGGSGGSGGTGGTPVDTADGDENFSNLSLLTACNPLTLGHVPSFSGAEGFGSCTTGGRGGRVIHVTTLNESGPGSLQAALDIDEPRIIVFDVSGVIRRTVNIAHGNVTIAGQTAPGGITVLGLICNNTTGSGDNCYNVIVRNIRSRPGTLGSDGDALRLDGAQRVIIDHGSFGNATDEAVQISQAANITLQNSLLAETLGGHAQYGGLLMNYSSYFRPQDYLSIHHNLWTRIGSRYPELSCENNPDYYADSGNSDACGVNTIHAEISYNLFWDAQYFVVASASTNNSDVNLGAPLRFQLNFVKNYSKVRPNYPYALIHIPTPRASGQISTYFNGNKLSLYPTRSDYELNYGDNDYSLSTTTIPSVPSYARSTRHDFPALTDTETSALRSYMVSNVGAFPRDAMDQRLMAPVVANTIDTSTAINVNPASDALTACTNSAGNSIPSDTDRDGMPDTWETTNHLDPATQDHNGYDLSASYTNIEVYLNQLMVARLSQTCS